MAKKALSREISIDTGSRQGGCWSTFKSFFKDEQFDLVITPENQGYGNFHSSAENDRLARYSIQDARTSESEQVNNKIYSLGKKRMSLRPSVFLSKIQEESGANADFTEDDTNDSASGVRVVEVPPDLFKIPEETFQLWWLSPSEGPSWGVGRLCAAAAARHGGTATALPAAASDGTAPHPPAVAAPPHALLVDARLRRPSELKHILSWARHNYGLHVYFIAVVTKSTYMKDDETLRQFLEMGFDRVLDNSGGAMRWRSEMVQAAAAARSRRGAFAGAAALLAALRLAASPAGAAAPHASHQSVGRVSICGADNAVLVSCGDGAVADSEALELPPPDGGAAPLRQRIAPHKGTSAWHTVLAWSRSPSAAGIGPGRGSLASLRRDSSQAAGEGGRRTSLARLALEAPITKAAALLEAAANAAASGAAASAAALVTRAAEALRAVDLYRPELYARGKHERALMDPLAGDLVAALLAQQPAIEKGVHSSRRSSGDSTARTHANRLNIELPEYKVLTAGIINWHWDVFLLERASRRRPLVPAGAALFAHFDVAATLNCDEQTLYAWLALIEDNYHASIAYHTGTHAADVMQAVAVFMQRGSRILSALGPLGTAAALIAAAAHDVGHPGASAAFLCNSRHSLALLYNDQSVLESHHAALTFRLTLGDDRVNILKGLEKDQFQAIRRDIVDMILATEMTKHFEHLAKFVNVFNGKPRQDQELQIIDVQDDQDSSWDINLLEQPENVTLVKRMLIKTADVSNTARPMKICIEWASRICEEYFSQTDAEKALGLPVVMPGFERSTCSIPRSQKGFYDYIIADMMEAWAAFVEMPELIQISHENSERWRQMEEQGLVTLQDIKKAAANFKDDGASSDDDVKFKISTE